MATGRLAPNGCKKTSLFPIGAAHSGASLNRRGGVAAELIRRLRVARKRGYVTPAELEAVCYWKSPRAIQYIRSNSPAQVGATTRSALATRSERRRLEALRQLKGVSVPMASALLMLLNPKRYGVIDIRVWQLLHKIGTVSKKRRGGGVHFSRIGTSFWSSSGISPRSRGERSGCRTYLIYRSQGVPSRSPLQVFRVTAA